MTSRSSLHRLDLEGLARLDAAARPLVDPRTLGPRIVHFGLGAFHRAHQAVYAESAAAATGEPSGIVDVEAFSSRSVEEISSQDCLYSVTDRAPGALRTRVVVSVTDAGFLADDAARVRGLMASADVGTTHAITEKGHYRDLLLAVAGRLEAVAAGRGRAVTANGRPA
jgi:fructuronate reductase